nr:reverse transcriptase domain-containing protein [Tanacetum cinerariifolium]
GHNNDRHGSDRRGGSDNHRSSNNNYSASNNRNSGYGRDQRNRGQQSNRSANSGHAANTSGTITGTLFIYGYAVFVLFDTGATHSVISSAFASRVTTTPT